MASMSNGMYEGIGVTPGIDSSFGSRNKADNMNRTYADSYIHVRNIGNPNTIGCQSSIPSLLYKRPIEILNVQNSLIQTSGVIGTWWEFFQGGEA